MFAWSNLEHKVAHRDLRESGGSHCHWTHAGKLASPTPLCIALAWLRDGSRPPVPLGSKPHRNYLELAPAEPLPEAGKAAPHDGTLTSKPEPAAAAEQALLQPPWPADGPVAAAPLAAAAAAASADASFEIHQASRHGHPAKPDL